MSTAPATAANRRTSETAVDPLFLERWSPRVFKDEAIDPADLRTLFDAGHWAPSAYNYQPWRVLYAVKGDEHWDRFLGGLIPFNQSWVKSGSVIVYFLSDTLMFGDDPAKAHPAHSHSFDTGSFWASLALQASRLGLQAHGMTGVDWDKARAELGVPERYRIEAAAAIGRPADPETLTDEQRAKETPSGRKAIDEVVFHGPWPA